MMLKAVFRILLILVGLLLVAVALHIALIEVGREVVVLRLVDQDGGSYSRRLWAVDYDGAVWVHSGCEDWLEVFSGDREVLLQRGEEEARYHASPMSGRHPEIHNALRAKYGIADRWVRFLGPDSDTVLAVRLERINENGNQ